MRNLSFKTLIHPVGLLLVGSLLGSGCGGTGQVQLGAQNGSTVSGSVTYGTTNLQGGLTGSYDLATGEWAGGLTLTFSRPPAAATVTALTAAGAVPVKAGPGVAYTLAKYDDASNSCRAAVLAALADGAVVTRN